MKYNPTQHIKHNDLAIEAGITSSALAGLVRRGASPTPAGRQRIGRTVSTFFDRTEALRWAAQMRPKPAGQIAPPSDINLMTRRAWKPRGVLADNFSRASELYPHRIITPDGTGNYREFANNARRGA